jgi:hypothetical protein
VAVGVHALGERLDDRAHCLFGGRLSADRRSRRATSRTWVWVR